MLSQAPWHLTTAQQTLLSLNKQRLGSNGTRLGLASMGIHVNRGGVTGFALFNSTRGAFLSNRLAWHLIQGFSVSRLLCSAQPEEEHSSAVRFAGHPYSGLQRLEFCCCTFSGLQLSRLLACASRLLVRGVPTPVKQPGVGCRGCRPKTAARGKSVPPPSPPENAKSCMAHTRAFSYCFVLCVVLVVVDG